MWPLAYAVHTMHSLIYVSQRTRSIARWYLYIFTVAKFNIEWVTIIYIYMLRSCARRCTDTDHYRRYVIHLSMFASTSLHTIYCCLQLYDGNLLNEIKWKLHVYIMRRCWSSSARQRKRERVAKCELGKDVSGVFFLSNLLGRIPIEQSSDEDNTIGSGILWLILIRIYQNNFLNLNIIIHSGCQLQNWKSSIWPHDRTKVLLFYQRWDARCLAKKNQLIFHAQKWMHKQLNLRWRTRE